MGTERSASELRRRDSSGRRRARRSYRAAETSTPSVPRPIRLLAFAAIALVAGAAAVGLLVWRLQGPAATDVSAVQIHASMGGFEPTQLAVKAGQSVRIELTSMDDSMHSDGGGWHQFAIDALGVDWKVGPLATQVFTLSAPTAPGTYTWYCDICCGGKENPSMHGTLVVTA